MWKKKRNRAKEKVEVLIQKYDLEVDTLYETKTDTVLRLDTFVMPEIRLDTLFSWYMDTLYVIEKDGVETRIQIRPDTMWLSTTVHERDTVFEVRDVIRTVTKTVQIDTKPERVWSIPWWIYLIIALLSGGLIYLMVRKLIKF